MKSCPICNRTFEDTFTFCLADGSLLSAPFDPQATLVIPEPRQTDPPPTEVRKPVEETRPEIPPSISTTEPMREYREAAPTVASSLTEFETVEAPPRIRDLTPPARKSPRLPLMIGALVTLLIIGAAVFILGNRTESARQNPTNENAATANTAATEPANATNSADSGTSPDDETTSSNQPAPQTESAGGEPLPSPSRSSRKKVTVAPSPTVNSGRKDTPMVAKPTRPAVNASTSPCANKSYPVCEPGERLRCNAATGSWECRRSVR